MTFVIEQRGRESYSVTWARQRELHALRVKGAVPDTLIFVEHEPVITLGRQGDSANLLIDAEGLRAAGFELHRVERGGDITYHGPGQLVGYPILSLREHGLSVRDFVGRIESALIGVAEQFGIAAGRVNGLTGVWVAGDGRAGPPPESLAAAVGAPLAKLAAIGVAVQRGVSYHGFALNVSTDLSHFNHIVPCGITQYGVTSLSVLLGGGVSVAEAIPVAGAQFDRVFFSASPQNAAEPALAASPAQSEAAP